MNIYRSIQAFRSEKKTILTLGTFDGVHIGHKTILERLTTEAKERALESVVLTFFPHPRLVLNQGSGIKMINTIREKTTLLDEAGVDNLVIHPFDDAFSKMEAREFVENVLIKQFNIQKIIIGYDHRFGRNRTANIDDLIAFGKEYGFEVEQISAQEIGHNTVSSTKIREAVTSGDMDKANSYLGYPYMLSGVVSRGKQLGRTIGFPTANLHGDENYKLIPQTGVYVVYSDIDGKRVYGMMNIGYNPTFEETKLSVEVHYFEYSEDLYDKYLSVHILQRLRDEEKFPSVEALKSQLALDKEKSLLFIKNLTTK